METSKKIIVFLAVIEVLLLAFTCGMVVLLGDGSPLYYMISAISAEFGAATGFYYWKAKNENRSKYAMEFIEKIAEQYGIDMAVRISDIVIKD